MDGAWVGAIGGDGLEITLHAQRDGTVTGNGFIDDFLRGRMALEVRSGVYSPPHVSVVLAPELLSAFTLSGRVEEFAIRAEANGSGFERDSVLLTRTIR